MKHIIDFTWRSLKPQVVLRDLKLKQIDAVPLLGLKFNWKFSGKRLCPGIFPSTKEKSYLPCPENKDLSGTKYERCRACEDTIGFKSAFLFHQLENITNPELKRYLAQKHYIYLAYFQPDIIKVGTASKERKMTRLYEQDALSYCFIAENNGFEIQRMERFISKSIRLREAISLKHKIKFIGVPVNYDYAERLLKRTHDDIARKVEQGEFSSWLVPKVECERLDLSRTIISEFNSKQLADIDFRTELDHVSGRVIAVRGRLIIFENNNNLFAMDGKKLVSQVIEEKKEAAEMTHSEQMGLI